MGPGEKSVLVTLGQICEMKTLLPSVVLDFHTKREPREGSPHTWDTLVPDVS